MQKLERLVNKKKIEIDKETKKDKDKLDFIKKLFLENSEIINEHMKENNLSLKEGYDSLREILYSLNTPLYITKGGKDKKIISFQLKKVNEFLAVKLGWYDLPEEEKIKLNPEMYVEQCTLWATEKGKKVEKDYRKFCRGK